MQVQINTDRNIEGSETLSSLVQDVVDRSLGRFEKQISRVEVHLSDVNGHKTRDDDKQCIMEARPAGMQPVAVTHAAATVEQAVDGAAQKLNRLLDSTFGRLNDRKKGGVSFAGEQDD